MGREVWIYQVERKERKGLRDLLTSKSRFKHSFASFLEGRKEAFGENYVFEYESVLTSLSENVTPIPPGLLFEITYWLSETNQIIAEEYHDLLADEAGISLLYESSTKSEANSFMIFYYGYLDLIGEADGYLRKFDDGMVVSSQAFMNFLEFFIFFLDQVRINIIGGDEASLLSDSKEGLNEITAKRSTDLDFSSIVNTEFEKFASLVNLHQQHPDDNSIKKHPELDLISRNDEMLTKMLATRQRVKNEEVNVILIDSK